MMKILSTIAGLPLIIVPGSGLFIAARLILTKENKVANRTLAILICAAAAEVLHVFTLESEQARIFFHYSLNLAHFLVPPLLLLYVRSALLVKHKFSKIDSLHLVPFILCATLYLGSLVPPPLSAGVKPGVTQLFAPQGTGNAAIMVLLFIQFSVYFAFVLKSLYDFKLYHRREVSAETGPHAADDEPDLSRPARFFSQNAAPGKHSSELPMQSAISPQNDRRLLRWLQSLSMFAFAIYVFAALDFLLPRDFYFFCLVTICLMILFVHTAMMRYPSVFFESAAPARKYRTTLLQPAIAAEYLEQIEMALAEEELFKDPSLTLESFGRHLHIPPHHISQVINSNYAVNFSQHVNTYRLRHAQQLLSRTDGTMNILHIAYESGFNSKSAFNTFFKKETGLPPREYRRLHGNNFQKKSSAS